jgi:hypothetical protein
LIEGAIMSAKTVIAGEDTKSGIEQRTSNRLSFRRTQRIAPYDGGPVPPDDAFYIVPFSDISQGGFSYLADNVPEYRTLVVAMQIHQQVVPMQARILHHRKCGQQYVMGCQFEGRITDESASK